MSLPSDLIDEVDMSQDSHDVSHGTVHPQGGEVSDVTLYHKLNTCQVKNQSKLFNNSGPKCSNDTKLFNKLCQMS